MAPAPPGPEPMRPCKIVWIASMPRVGSMWSYNVCRALVAEAGFRVEPAEALRTNEEALEAARRGLRSADPAVRTVVKTHLLVDPTTRASLFVVPLRDPRDALVSAQRFLHLPDFDAALSYTTDSLRTVEHYENPAFGDRILHLDYRQIVDAPDAAIRAMAAHLGIAAGQEAVEALAARFARARVGETLGRLAEDSARALMTFNPDGSPRLFDRETGFQTGHVSDYREGGWRELLTTAQLVAIDRTLGPWLARRGYPRTLP